MCNVSMHIILIKEEKVKKIVSSFLEYMQSYKKIFPKINKHNLFNY